MGRGFVAAAGGDEVLVNGASTTDVNLNDTTPAASAGRVNFLWQSSGASPTSASVQTPASVPIVLDREPTDLTISNSTTETVIFSHSVPANAMGTNRMLYLCLLSHWRNNTGAARFFTFRVKFGGTTIYQDDTATIGSSAVNVSAVHTEILVVNQNATNDQTGGGVLNRNVGVLPTTGIAGALGSTATTGAPTIYANAALDTTAAQTLEATIQLSFASVDLSFTRKSGLLMLQ